MAPGGFSLRPHAPSRPRAEWRALTPTLFQGAVREGSLPTAAAAAETPLSTCEDEEASGVPTGGPPSIMPTAAPEQADTFVSAPSTLCGSQEQRGQHPGAGAVRPPRGRCPRSPRWVLTSGKQEAMEGA